MKNRNLHENSIYGVTAFSYKLYLFCFEGLHSTYICQNFHKAEKFIYGDDIELTTVLNTDFSDEHIVMSTIS